MFCVYWERPFYYIHHLTLMGIGVKGVVADSGTDIPIVGASVEIVGRDHPTNTTKQGEYWRYLLPGQYQMHVSVYRLASVITAVITAEIRMYVSVLQTEIFHQ